MICKLCDLGAGYGEGMTQRAMAAAFGVGQATVHRHRKHTTPEPTNDYIESYGLDPKDYELERVSIRTEDNSWLKLKKKNTRVALLEYDDLADLWERPIPVYLHRGEREERVEVFCASDFQLGKAGEKGGGTRETLQRVRNSVAAFVERVKRTKPTTIVIAELGDGIENVFNTPMQAFTNDMDVVTQIRTLRRLLAEIIVELSPYADELVLVSVPSNHSGFRVAKGTQGGTIDADFGLDVNYALEEQFTGRPGFEHVTFVRPEPLEDTATLEVGGTKLAFNHGYESRGIHKHGEWWSKRDHGRLPGWDADILVMAHYHTFNIQHSGNARWIISTSSSDPGSDWFTRKTGESSRAGVTVFAVSDGQWKDVEII